MFNQKVAHGWTNSMCKESADTRESYPADMFCIAAQTKFALMILRRGEANNPILFPKDSQCSQFPDLLLM